MHTDNKQPHSTNSQTTAPLAEISFMGQRIANLEILQAEVGGRLAALEGEVFYLKTLLSQLGEENSSGASGSGQNHQ